MGRLWNSPTVTLLGGSAARTKAKVCSFHRIHRLQVGSFFSLHSEQTQATLQKPEGLQTRKERDDLADRATMWGPHQLHDIPPTRNVVSTGHGKPTGLHTPHDYFRWNPNTKSYCAVLKCCNVKRPNTLSVYTLLFSLQGRLSRESAPSEPSVLRVPHGGRQDLTPASYPLASMPWFTHAPLPKINK